MILRTVFFFAQAGVTLEQVTYYDNERPSSKTVRNAHQAKSLSSPTTVSSETGPYATTTDHHCCSCVSDRNIIGYPLHQFTQQRRAIVIGRRRPLYFAVSGELSGPRVTINAPPRDPVTQSEDKINNVVNVVIFQFSVLKRRTRVSGYDL